MAWKEVTDVDDLIRTFAADSDDDISSIESSAGGIPVGSLVIANNEGATAVWYKFPSAFGKLGSNASDSDDT